MYKYEKYKRDYTQLPRRFHSFIWINHPLWITWHNMKSRCYDKNRPNYENYGGRGIKVCDNWVFDFEEFLKDMGDRPSDKHSIDRIDNNGNYEPSNCKWSTRVEQNSNKGVYSNSSTGYVGISRSGDKYIVRKYINGKRKYLAKVKTLNEAICVYENDINYGRSGREHIRDENGRFTKAV